MKKTHAIQLAGSATELAKVLDITQGAISQWGEDVPELRVWQLKELKPEWFQGQTFDCRTGNECGAQSAAITA